MADELLEKMILEGVIEVVGIDAESGEFLYSFTKKLKESYPNFYNEVQNFITKEVMELWQSGFISMDVTDKNPLVSLTEKAFIESEVQKLDKELQYALSEIKRATAL